jgi:hypothetical protein
MIEMNGTFYFINYIKTTILSSYALINRIAVNMKKKIIYVFFIKDMSQNFYAFFPGPK